MAEETKKHDETVPGGRYILGDRFVDADGKDLGPASAKDLKVETPVAEPDTEAKKK
ncbi:MAG: hypothetical protein LC734_02035 [Acidobacteria bacterium]|nr:hypothetical protein [Acidobacteriota bacterium]